MPVTHRTLATSSMVLLPYRMEVATPQGRVPKRPPTLQSEQTVVLA